MARDPNLITATWIEVYDVPSGATTTIVPDDGYSDRFPQYSPNRDEIAWARGTDPTCCEAPSDIRIMSGDGSSQLNLTDDPETDNAYPHFSLEGDHVFYLAGSVLQVIDREGIEEPQVLFDLGEVSNFDIASSYPPPLCGEIVDGHDYMGFVPGRLWLAAYTEAQIAKDAVIEAAEKL